MPTPFFALKLLKRIRKKEGNSGGGRDYIKKILDDKKYFKKQIEKSTSNTEEKAGNFSNTIYNILRKRYNEPKPFEVLYREIESDVLKINVKRPEQEYLKKRREKYYINLTEWHFRLAIADILLGCYDQLDPIVGDQACQMRPPFLLDAIAIVKEELVETCRKNKIQPEQLIDDARHVRGHGIQYQFDTHPELTGSTFRQIFEETSELFTQFCDTCWNSLAVMAGPHRAVFRGDKAYNTTWNGKNLTERIEFYNDKAANGLELGDTFNGADYLRMCKTFARNREAKIDEFGIDIDHESDLAFYDIAGKKKWGLKNQSQIMADLEKQYFAHCSTGYMKYIAQELATVYDQNVFDDICKLFNQCSAHINRSGFLVDLLPVYEAFRVVLAHAAFRRHPIVINLTRMNVNNEALYQKEWVYQKNWVLYYEPEDDGHFRYVEKPTDEQLNKPAIGIVAASVYNPDMLLDTGMVADSDFVNEPDANSFIKKFMKYDIVHLLMWFALNHPVFPGGARYFKFNKPDRDEKPTIVELINKNDDPNFGRDYLHSLYEDVLKQDALEDGHYEFSLSASPCPLLGATDQKLAWGYNYYYQLTEALGVKLENVKYALMDGRRYSHDGKTKWNRNLQTLPFTPTHVYVTTLATEQKKREILNLSKNFSVGPEIWSTMRTKSEVFGETYGMELAPRQTPIEERPNIELIAEW